MPKYDGANIYNEQLTNYEENYCQERAKGLPQVESYCNAYINVNTKELSYDIISSRCYKLEHKPRIKKRLEELNTLNQIKTLSNNQTQAEKLENIKNNPRDFLLIQFYEFIKECKYKEDRSNQFKGLEAMAKLFNLYSDGNITNNQLNQIVINAPDVNSAIDSIHALVNNTGIKQIKEHQNQ